MPVFRNRPEMFSAEIRNQVLIFDAYGFSDETAYRDKATNPTYLFSFYAPEVIAIRVSKMFAFDARVIRVEKRKH
jgi:hypothetical protein